MRKIFIWLKQSNRLKHFAGGYVIGVCSDSTYCGLYAGVIAASSLEFKDKSLGGEWDWINCIRCSHRKCYKTINTLNL